MPRVTLTDAFCRSAKAEGGKLTEYADTKERGLALRVTADGVKSWTYRFRTAGGVQRRLSLGRLDAISLADARTKIAVERGQVANGSDPVELRKQGRLAAVAFSKLETIGEIGARYFEDAAAGRHKPNARAKRDSTLQSERAYFDRLIIPRLGNAKPSEVGRAQVQAFLNDVSRKGSASAARQCKAILRAIFNFAIWQELASVNPCQFATVQKAAPRERTLSAAELYALWRILKETNDTPDLHVSQDVADALRLCAITLQRRAEVSGMAKSELDLAARGWTIPGARTKNHRAHVVPLSDAAVEILSSAVERSGDSTYVFPSPRAPNDDDKPIHPAALSHAFRRILKASDLTGLRPHDLRRTGATHLTGERLGFPRFIVSRVLNHVSDTGGAAAVTGVYDRNSYLAEKRKAMDAWSRELLSIVGEARPSADIVPLRA